MPGVNFRNFSRQKLIKSLFFGYDAASLAEIFTLFTLVFARELKVIAEKGMREKNLCVIQRRLMSHDLSSL